MARQRLSNAASGALLAALALCAMAMSSAFFLHARHAAEERMEAMAAKARALPGVTLMDGDPAEGRPGVIVTSMETDGQAARLGISVGDGVVSLDGMPIRSLDQASAYLLHHSQPRIALGLKHADRMRVVMLDRPEGGR
ncbi:PDZ/DHR/GLGF domain protein [Sphingobium chlorophenolicum L-1]|uniref:PDZ/DHR/GLGF domain protein n=2 Tax=Sphingobium chlorophenolicum TaxID=46429 RepID=F6EYU6_SPHCR|nr:PDZ domain-containing protein [Sphingobium chlorophenolicum]AEG50146.1 PDZ/DHR/GLGF domain protein [Sphingobium chlorophenolicum L-1]KEQ53369.1 PDZ/DHR/GLGF domain protein precursor [Sphingobium chlorophenolicum]